MSKKSKHLIGFEKSRMRAGESVIAWGEGSIEKLNNKKNMIIQNGVLIVTNKQVAFYRKSLVGDNLKTIALKKITSVEKKSVNHFQTIDIKSPLGSFEFKSFDNNDDKVLSDAIENLKTIYKNNDSYLLFP